MKNKLIILIFTLIAQSSFGQQLNNLYGDYLGQTPPGNVPVEFAPGIITGFVHGGMAISPEGDEIYWSVSPSYIYYSKLENGSWTEPALADFVKEFQAYQNEAPVFSPDGKKLFFSSNRPGGKGKTDTWFVERNENGWGSPINAGEPYNSTDVDRSPLFSKKGHAFCLRMDKEYKTIPLCFEYFNGKFSGPDSIEYIPEYGPWWNLYISPEEDYIIFTGDNKDDPSNEADLYIRFKNKEGQWSMPVNMGMGINTKKWDRFPFVSPDGKYLFFTRGGSNSAALFWVSTAIIDSMKITITGIPEKKETGEIENFKLFQNFPNPFNPETEIKYQLSLNANVILQLYDSLGQEVKTLVDSFQNAGEHSIVWNSKNGNNNNVCSGIYFYRLKVNDRTLQKKMLLIQ